MFYAAGVLMQVFRFSDKGSGFVAVQSWYAFRGGHQRLPFAAVVKHTHVTRCS
jgi:hypothetical protein